MVAATIAAAIRLASRRRWGKQLSLGCACAKCRLPAGGQSMRIEAIEEVVRRQRPTPRRDGDFRFIACEDSGA